MRLLIFSDTSFGDANFTQAVPLYRTFNSEVPVSCSTILPNSSSPVQSNHIKPIAMIFNDSPLDTQDVTGATISPRVTSQGRLARDISIIPEHRFMNSTTTSGLSAHDYSQDLEPQNLTKINYPNEALQNEAVSTQKCNIPQPKQLILHPNERNWGMFPEHMHAMDSGQDHAIQFDATNDWMSRDFLLSVIRSQAEQIQTLLQKFEM